jgi:hypothetical protein
LNPGLGRTKSLQNRIVCPRRAALRKETRPRLGARASNFGRGCENGVAMRSLADPRLRPIPEKQGPDPDSGRPAPRPRKDGPARRWECSPFRAACVRARRGVGARELAGSCQPLFRRASYQQAAPRVVARSRRGQGGVGPEGSCFAGGAFIRATSALEASCRTRRGCLDDDRDDSANRGGRAPRSAHQVAVQGDQSFATRRCNGRNASPLLADTVVDRVLHSILLVRARSGRGRLGEELASWVEPPAVNANYAVSPRGDNAVHAVAVGVAGVVGVLGGRLVGVIRARCRVGWRSSAQREHADHRETQTSCVPAIASASTVGRRTLIGATSTS